MKMNKRYKIIILSLISVAVVLAVAALILFLNIPKTPTATPDEALSTVQQNADDTAAPGVVITEAAQPTEELATEEPTEEPTEVPPSAPDALLDTLSLNGNSLQDLTDLGCTQLVTVRTSGSSASIDLYTLSGGQWTVDESLSCSGYVGRNGATYDMHEGGQASPKGLYGVGEAFYIYSKPETGLETFEVTNDTYWVDDPDSVYYNKRVEGTADKDWNSAEHMVDYTTAYEYGFVVEYNTAAEYGKGSAIFFHVSYNPTAGCIGTDRDHVLGYLRALDASANPHIIIV